MGPGLELVVLEMTEEDQMERVRTRARGSEQAVEILKVRFYMHFRFCFQQVEAKLNLIPRSGCFSICKLLLSIITVLARAS